MNNTKINSMKISLIAEMNDSCREKEQQIMVEVEKLYITPSSCLGNGLS